MTDTTSDAEERKEALFISLVALLSQQAMMAMGKLVPPGADEPMIDLEVSRAMIDTLDVLRVRTEGNLTTEESRYLELQLTNLRLNFLECQKDAAGESGSEGTEAEEESDKDSEKGED